MVVIYTNSIELSRLEWFGLALTHEYIKAICFYSVKDKVHCIFLNVFFVVKQIVWYQISYSNRLFQHLEDHSQPRPLLVSSCQPYPPAGDVLHAGNSDPHLASGTPCKDKNVFIIFPIYNKL